MTKLDQREAADRLHALLVGVTPGTDRWESNVLAAHHALFEANSNPRHPWFALSWARRRRLEVPGWVLDYLAAAADEMNKRLGDQGNGREAEVVGRALGFGAAGKGQTAQGAQAHIELRDQTLAFRVVLLEMAEADRGSTLKRESAVAQVMADAGVSRSVVFAALAKFEQNAVVQVQSLICAFPEPGWTRQE